MNNIDITKLTLGTQLYHYYHTIQSIKEIKNDSIVVICRCRFLDNTFTLRFVNDDNTFAYTDKGCRHISELRLIPFSN